MPPLSELWLVSGDTDAKVRQKAIQFGAEVQDLHQVLGRFAHADTVEGFSLFHECREWLEREREQWWRWKWTDRIF